LTYPLLVALEQGGTPVRTLVKQWLEGGTDPALEARLTGLLSSAAVAVGCRAAASAAAARAVAALASLPDGASRDALHALTERLGNAGDEAR
jgi:hypothetical protein